MKPASLASLCAVILMVQPVLAADPVPAYGQGPLVQRVDESRSQRLLDKAVARFREVGDAAFDEFNRAPQFKDRELYVYVLGMDGTMLASGGTSVALVGRNVATMQDSAGKPFFREMLDAAAKSDAGRVEYRWLNREDKREEHKVTLFRKVGERVVAVGYYVPRATPAQAKDLLERAVARVKEKGAQAALESFNALNGGFMQDDLYVFAIDLDSQRFLAHGAMPKMVGTDGHELRDAQGKAIVADMVNIASRKGAGELDYTWRNPVTDKVETKHSFIRKVDGMLVGVGYYTR
ncbi:MAG TPA: cache domain-containing protein [Aromatoleum sp.]|uniref:cache domain-containing protein n=1 Tax=Aromatoleum sp. TaxID=2307007 RepID=UPI002B47428A|nr:cache domain-containing protein [Aromatoleum sp.]HJV27150.1 cache domain-containing protein [Aromatoleum sp.]